VEIEAWREEGSRDEKWGDMEEKSREAKNKILIVRGVKRRVKSEGK
jgi:hypothetical protein